MTSRGAAFPLPAALSSFVGRDTDIVEVRKLLATSRLVTLTGAPGIGKSRLALEVAGGSGDTGTALVELASIADPELVPRAVAAVLSVQEVAGSTLIEALVAHLQRRSLRLVLDNCEHLIEACVALVDGLLSDCPQLRVLATSREPLSVAGERVWQVSPLSVPDESIQPLPEVLMGYEAVCLFVERASAVRPQFVLTGEVAPAVAEICRRLDGIPLAIELAAARIDVLTPEEIAGRLDHRFELLTKGSRGDLPRHQTLRAALDWSYELLPVSQRVLLRRLSVFVGGFCLEGVQAACTGTEVEAGAVFDLLAQLVSKSLVVSDTANSRARYRLLETVRAYSADRLEEASEGPAVAEAHAAFYLGLAEQAEPELTGPDQERWLERLDADRENLRFALRWSLGHGHSEWGLRLAGALVLFWRVRCYFGEGRDLLEASVHENEPDSGREASALGAKALWGIGFLALMAGDPVGARAPLEESLAAFRELGDPQGAARTLLILGNSGLSRADPRALTMLEESATLARKADDSWCLAHALGAAGYEHTAHNELAAARPLFEEGLAVARRAQDKQGVRYGLIGLGRVAARQGDYTLAEPLLEEALDIARKLREDYAKFVALVDLGELTIARGAYGPAKQLLEQAMAVLPGLAPVGASVFPLLGLAKVADAEGDRPRARHLLEQAAASVQEMPVAALQHLGELAAEDDDREEARGLLEKALAGARGKGDKWLAARSLHGLAQLSRTAGDARRATTLNEEALELRRQLGDAPGTAASLEAIAGQAAAAGRHQHAVRLFGAADALRRQGGYVPLPREYSRYEADLEIARGGLSIDEFEMAFGEGARLSIEEATTHASKGRRRRGRPAAGWDSLTETEQQIAALVAEGLTNPQIAERQLISAGTVKSHLSHIFTKLGLGGRRDLAREVWARQHDRAGAASSIALEDETKA